MILASLGKLGVAQALTDADEDSTNVIQLPAVAWCAFTDLWWVVTTTTIAATVGTLKFELVLATAANLTTAVQLCCVDIAAITDLRVATIGRHIAAFNIGKQLKQFMEGDMATYYFIGQKNTLSAGTTIKVDSALSPSEPHTVHHRQVVDSNVTVAPLPTAAAGFTP